MTNNLSHSGRDPQQPQTPEARHPSYTGRLTRPSRQPSTSMNTRQPSCGRRDWNDEKRGKTPASCPEKRLVKAQEPILPNVRTHTSVRDPSPSLGWAHSLKQKTSIASHRVRLMKAKAKQLPTWAWILGLSYSSPFPLFRLEKVDLGCFQSHDFLWKGNQHVLRTLQTLQLRATAEYKIHPHILTRRFWDAILYW